MGTSWSNDVATTFINVCSVHVTLLQRSMITLCPLESKKVIYCIVKIIVIAGTMRFSKETFYIIFPDKIKSVRET